jgi:hypothetical protein
VDDTNTIDGQLISAKPAARVSPRLAVQLKKYLSDNHYPITKSELYEAAARQGADSDILDAISGLKHIVYESFEDINKEINSAT